MITFLIAFDKNRTFLLARKFTKIPDFMHKKYDITIICINMF